MSKEIKRIIGAPYIKIIFALIIITILGVLFYFNYNKSDFTSEISKEEFEKGSNIIINNLDNNDVEGLSKLCKVWGFVKYYHPKAIEGSTDMDFQLFRLIPVVMKADSQKAVNKVIYDWVQSLGDFHEGVYNSNYEAKVTAPTKWIEDEEYLSERLSKALIKISKSYVQDRDKAYVNYKGNSIYSNFDNEKEYPVINYEDDGYKLLSVFRYWNIIQYYNPYRTIMEENWDEVLKEFIVKIIQSDDDLSYKLTLSELVSRIHDTHAVIDDNASTLFNYWGNNIAPIKFLVVDNKIVVTDIIKGYEEECALKVGDAIMTVNDKEIFEVIKERSKYLSFSREDAIVNTLAYNLFRTKEDSLILKVERAGSELTEEVKCYNLSEVNIAEVNDESHEILEGNIGYINPGALAKDEIGKVMKNLKDTEGIIVDLRYYPSDMIAYTMPNYLLPEKKVFSRGTIANKAVPGEFVFCEDIIVGMKNPDYYKGKVVIIINECTQSNGEFTAMALRMAPNAVVIGENSVGADGDVSYINLPGGVTTAISGIGIYTPETFETQRVGVKPDIYVKPTIEGIRSGKDELLEKAIEIVKDKK
ncbi:MAG: S41 family peptidase [Clostridium sp.]